MRLRSQVLLLAILLFTLAIVGWAAWQNARPSSRDHRLHSLHLEATPPSGAWLRNYRGDIAVVLVTRGIRDCGAFRYKKVSVQPPTYWVECPDSGRSYSVRPEASEASLVAIGKPQPTTAERRRTSPSSGELGIRDARYATAQDLDETRRFLASLPPVCGRSKASAAPDGTVTVRVLCKDARREVREVLTIRDGRITGLRPGIGNPWDTL
jgi:hypothetical protein